MGFDLTALQAAVGRHGRVIRVVIAAVHGSAPREAGAAMLVWEDGQAGTIGGGALEYKLTQAARRQTAARRFSRHALGPAMGQCCGGAVEVLTELFDRGALAALGPGPVIARPVTGAPQMPLAVKRLLATARSQGGLPAPGLVGGWMVEPAAHPETELWIWGAGHVGRALVATLAPLPGLALTWIDTAPARFPDDVPQGVTVLPAAKPEGLVARAPVHARHLIVTYSHALDLELCHRLLCRGFAAAGLIGSRTKWARFRNRLAALGHAPGAIARIRCPIGDPDLGKHPQAIAVGVAAELLRETGQTGIRRGYTA